MSTDTKAMSTDTKALLVIATTLVLAAVVGLVVLIASNLPEKKANPVDEACAVINEIYDDLDSKGPGNSVTRDRHGC